MNQSQQCRKCNLVWFPPLTPHMYAGSICQCKEPDLYSPKVITTDTTNLSGNPMNKKPQTVAIAQKHGIDLTTKQE